MSKQAKTKFGFHSLLENRWSPRSFRDSSIEKEKLQRIFEAASWAPSSYNEQPWRFIVGEKGNETYNKILEALVESNKLWAQKAPVLVVSLAKKYFSNKNKENFHFIYDTGQSVAHLTFQAMYEGLYVHQMAGFYFDILKNNFDIPEEYYIVTVIAIGYIGSSDLLDDNLKNIENAERIRKELNETVFKEKFGNSWNSEKE